MEKIEFECEVITPMFLHGADGKTPEIRAASIKGAMRFWWRAVNGHLPLKDLREREAQIFGGSGIGDCKSKFSIRVKKSKIILGKENTEIKKHIIKTNFKKKDKQGNYTENFIEINILDYLGFGIIQFIEDKKDKKKKNLITKNYIGINSNFTISIKYDKKYENEILKSLYFFFKFGNIGSKERNGFGGFKVIKGNILEKYELNFENIQLPSYTAFSKEAILFQSNNSYNTWDKALAEIGKFYREARLSIEKSHEFKERQYIALPLISKYEKTITDEMKENRKSKSYFLKIIKENDSYSGQILFLPSTFDIYGTQKERSLDNYKIMNKLLEKKMTKKTNEEVMKND